jgi:hypothetical protein
MRKLVVLLATSVALVGAVAGAAIADPGVEPTAAFTPHKHFLVMENGTLLEVGPRVCAEGTNSPRWDAFLQFHSNLHTHANVTGAIGPVAPGLHDANGPVLMPRACTFNP